MNRLLILAALAALAALCGCGNPAGDHAAEMVRATRRVVAWLDAGTVPTRGPAGEVVLVPASTTHALQFLRSDLRAWEAQAYYLDAGPRPEWLPKDK